MLVLVARLALAAASGAVTYLAVEPRGWWAAGIIGMAMLVAALSPWRKPLGLGWAALVACVHSAVLYLFTLPWIGELVGNMPLRSLYSCLCTASSLVSAERLCCA